MTFLLPLTVLLLIALAITLLFHRTLVETMPVAMFSITLCLYFGGLMRNLHVGILLVFLLLVTLWIYAARKKLLTRQNIAEHREEWIYSLIAVLPLFLLVYSMTSGLEMTIYDEYTHWGMAVKDLYLQNEFYCSPQAATDFKDYPPAIALFEYFFCVFGPFKSQNIYRGLNVLMLCATLPMYKNVVKKRMFLHICAGWMTTLLVLYGCYDNGMKTLLVDAALAMLLSCLLLYWFGSEKKDSFTVLSMGLNAMMLTLAKGSGVVLLLLALGVILADILTHPKEDRRVLLRAPALALVAAVLSWTSWRICTNLYGVAATRSQGAGLLQGMLSILSGNIEAYQLSTIYNFYKAFVYGENLWLVNKTTYFEWVWLLLLFGAFVAWIVRNDSRGRVFVLAGPVTHIIYSGFLLAAYILVFSPYESQTLASLSRYISSCYPGMLIFLFGCVLIEAGAGNEGKQWSLKKWAAPFVICAVAFLVLPYNYLLGAVFPLGAAGNADTQRFVQPYQSLRQLSEQVEDDVTVCLVSTSENDYDYYALVARYELAPREIVILTADKVNEEESLRGCDYLFVMPSLEEGVMIDGISLPAGTLYKVGNGHGLEPL